MVLRCVLLFAVLLLAPFAADGATSPESNARLAELLESLRATGGVPALAASVLTSRGAVATAAVGQLAADDATPVTPNSRFHLGTTGKALTGALAAVLAGRGNVRIPGPALLRRGELGAHEDWGTLTLASLLTHRSGLPAWAANDPDVAAFANASGAPTRQRQAAVRALLAAPPAQPPPLAKAVYSNAGYVVAGHLLEAEARVPFETLLQTEVFAPLGLRSCEVGGPSGAGDAQPHEGAIGTLRRVRKPAPVPAVLAPTGDVSCSVRDVARLAGAHLRGLALAGRPARTVVVRKDTRIVALRNTLGWSADLTGSGRDVYTLVGGNASYTAVIALFPDDDRALVVLANVGEQPSGRAFAIKALQAIRNRYGF